MISDSVHAKILADLPWVDHIRVLVGPSSSREVFKDFLLQQTPVLPSWCVSNLGDFAKELLKKAQTLNATQNIASVPNVIDPLSKRDALEVLSRSALFKSEAPSLSKYLKRRGVCGKFASFVTQLDRFWVYSSDLHALIEFFEAKNREHAAALKIIVQLWNQGELLPWSEGFYIREVLKNRENIAAVLPKEVFLLGYNEFTPLEQEFVEFIKAHCEVQPAASQSEFVSVEKIEFWEPHSVWDEFEFLFEALEQARKEKIAWSEIAIFTPADPLYVKVLRQKLDEWNVPVQDFSSTKNWKDNALWVWWRDLLRTVSTGLKIEDVRTVLGVGPHRADLLKQAYSKKIHGSAKQWMSLQKTFQIPELDLLLESVKTFARSMDVPTFCSAVEEISGLAEKNNFDSSPLVEFAQNLKQRLFLSKHQRRLPKFVALFEEFLEQSARSETLKAKGGVLLVPHGFELSWQCTKAFVLGATGIEPKKRGGAGGLEMSLESTVELNTSLDSAWNKIQSEVTSGRLWKKQEEAFERSLKAHRSLLVSAPRYDVRGADWAQSAFYKKLKSESVVSRSDGHSKAGWIFSSKEVQSSDVIVPGAIDFSKPLSVSSFEDYLKCPFLFYGRHLLRISPEEELGLDPNAKARGILIHRVLEKYLREEMQTSPIGEVSIAKKRISEIVHDEIFGGKPIEGLYLHKPLLQKTLNLVTVQAHAWVDWEFENRKKHPELKPILLEENIEIDFGALKFKGKVDRIDSNGVQAVIIDYKTGEPSFNGRELRQGLGAQLLLYAHGIQQKFSLEPAAVFYLKVDRWINGKKGIFLKKFQKACHTTHHSNSGLCEGEFSEIFEEAQKRWVVAAENLKSGVFTPNPARPEQECRACVYKKVCGYKVNG